MSRRRFAPKIAPRWQSKVHEITGPCNCHAAYVLRGLVDPFCAFHEYAGEISNALDAAYEQGTKERRE